jgi:isopentenyldiphosphate isomerase
LILMNSSGRIYLQKRSKIKSENTWMYDKTVGWHISAWDSFNMTAIKECAEELWFPATILEPEEFEKSIKTTDLNIIWIFKKIDYIPSFLSTRVLGKNSKMLQPQMTSIYFWYYDWPIKFVDWECSWIEVFSIEELKKEIIEKPNKFTEDLKFMVDKYGKHLGFDKNKRK